MTTEEKAKAYDEALNWMRELYPGLHGATKEDAEHYFPELRENEDERVRKWLVDYFSSIKETVWIHRDITCGQILAWLEKQKELDKMIVVLPEVWEDAISDAFENGKKEGEKQKEQKELPLMDGNADLYFDEWNQQKQNPTKRQCFEEGIRYAQRLQQEQKPNSTEDMPYITDERFFEREPADSFKYKLAEYMTKCCTKKEGPYGYTYGISAEAILKMAKEELIKRGELKEPKPTEYVNVKLNDGYPVVSSDKIVEDSAYCGPGVTVSGEKPVEHVTDAEMEKGLDELTKFKQFASALSDMYNIIPSHSSLRPKDIDWNNFCAGLLTYLKKNQPVEWSEEDRLILDSIIAVVEEWEDTQSDKEKAYYGATTKSDWLKSLSPQPKAELTLLDENIIKAAVAFVEQNDHFNCWGGIDKHTVIKALRSIKPQWKPSEQEKGALRTAIHILTDERNFPKAASHLQAILDAFDGKESHKDWKPSEEQMKALKWWSELPSCSPGLKSLYEDLKKL